MPNRGCVALIAGLCGCGPAVVVAGDDGGAATASASATSQDGDATTNIPPDNTGTTGSMPDVGPATGVGFIADPDGGWPGYECSTWEQDCPAGEKCVFYADDGGSSWNATHCVPVDPDPAPDGEPCTYEGIDTGIDDCQLGSMCWNVDGETSMGVCASYCSGSEANPICPLDDQCSISSSGFNLCLPRCDPLTQDCAQDFLCVGSDRQFLCVRSTEDAGPGDPCEYINACAAGLACVNAHSVPGCTGSGGCCSPYCMVGDDTACNTEAGQSCVSWFEEGSAPPGLEHIGVCFIRE